MDTSQTHDGLSKNHNLSQDLIFSTDQEDLIEERRFEKLFKVEKIVGKGAYGEVYKAIHKLDKGVYAIKRVAIRESTKRSLEQTIERVLREVSAMVVLNHQSIVRYFTCWLEKDSSNEVIRAPNQTRNQSESNLTLHSVSDQSAILTLGNDYSNPNNNAQDENLKRLNLFIQLEFCAGETLRHYLNTGKPERNLVKMMEMFIKILDGVNTFHKAGILHRDLKPENIFLDANGNIKIGDFGLALSRLSVSNHYEAVNRPQDPFLTSNVGTMAYMSPEIQNGLSLYDNKTDVYSLGCILYEMLRVFKSDEERHEALLNLRENRRIPEDFKKKYPEESAIILKMTNLDPQDRPGANELLNEIAKRKNFHDGQKFREETAKVIGYNNKKGDPPAQTSSLLVENDRGLFSISQGLKGDLVTNPPGLDKMVTFKYLELDKKGLPANAIFKSLA